MFLQREKDIQIISKVAELELYNKMVQNNLFIFRIWHGGLADFFPIVCWKTLFLHRKLYIVARFVSGETHLTVYSLRVKIVEAGSSDAVVHVQFRLKVMDPFTCVVVMKSDELRCFV